MFRSRTSTLLRARLPVHASFPRFVRYSSTSAPPKKAKLLVGVGILAIGSTIVAALYNKDSPKAAVEPQGVARAFPDGKIDVVFVLGGPGSGKGTQCAKLVNEKGYVHLSAGDLLRAEQNRKGSEYGDLIRQYIREGKIVPQEVTIALLQQAIQEKYSEGATKFLVDGFPRKMDQALTFEEKIARSSITLFFECPEAVMLKRLLERGKTSGRDDDNEESIKKRFRTFLDTSMPVVDYFEEQGKVLKVLCDQPVDEVYRQVTEALKGRGI
ncbi:bifunctional uridylate/adenylate kinase [Naganishia cerealis]|uniref:Bifunctional uridylate/adenylate kinase n=1 Tax=Naganishia cerealis TaxID=610337 RepID=A0ACC2VJV3_9TREE|nr:bifunctional uridylate/adenylate kinase [Naganishia cerealis]